jgi:hypothetical protein
MGHIMNASTDSPYPSSGRNQPPTPRARPALESDRFQLPSDPCGRSQLRRHLSRGRRLRWDHSAHRTLHISNEWNDWSVVPFLLLQVKGYSP